MNGGITKVRGEGIPTMRGVNALEVLRYFVESFVPSEPLPTVRSAADGILEPVFIVVKILQCDCLRADVPAAERVVFVPTDVQTLVCLNSDLDTAYRFAEIACAVMRRAIASGSHDTAMANSIRRLRKSHRLEIESVKRNILRSDLLFFSPVNFVSEVGFESA